LVSAKKCLRKNANKRFVRIGFSVKRHELFILAKPAPPVRTDSYGIHSNPVPVKKEEESEHEEEEDAIEDDDEEGGSLDSEEAPSKLSFFIFSLSYSSFVQTREQMKVVVMFVNIVHYSYVMSHLMQPKKNYQKYYQLIVNVVLYLVV
jgi:hypothetical protein